MNNETNIGFALGGLAGNNAHGAGFLHAALVKQVKPSMISCTSGQIHWTYLYVKALRESNYLLLEEEINKQTLVQKDYVDRIKTAAGFLMGQQLIRLAYPSELAEDVLKTISSSLQKIYKDIIKEHNIRVFMEIPRLFLNLVPGRLLAPNFPTEYLNQIAQNFNASDIGIIYNTYNPVSGCEHVHLNEAAKKKLGVDYDATDCDLDKEEVECEQRQAVESRYRYRTRYKEITAESVMDALWIYYAYGFDKSIHPIYRGTQEPRIDGALYRQIVLSELVSANRIYVVRPVNSRWKGALPHNWPGNEDMKWEMMFNSAYMGERDKIHLINKLLHDKKVPEEYYHCIDLVELEIQTQEAYLEYAAESKDVFNQARQQALKEFEKTG